MPLGILRVRYPLLFLFRHLENKRRRRRRQHLLISNRCLRLREESFFLVCFPFSFTSIPDQQPANSSQIFTPSGDNSSHPPWAFSGLVSSSFRSIPKRKYSNRTYIHRSLLAGDAPSRFPPVHCEEKMPVLKHGSLLSAVNRVRARSLLFELDVRVPSPCVRRT